MSMLQYAWVFHPANGRFCSGVFTSLEAAEKVIKEHSFSGVLTMYPLDDMVYFWALANSYFVPKNNKEREAEFIQKFTSASLVHYHYENGER